MRNLIMVIGGTATGKTTFIKRRYENHEGVSLYLYSSLAEDLEKPRTRNMW